MLKDMARLLISLTLIASLAGLLLSLVESATREPIKEQRRLQMIKALSAVLPEFDNSPDTDTITLENGVNKKGEPIEAVFYRARKEGTFVGTAFEMVAPDGYSGNIAVMVGLRPDEKVNAIKVLTHAETPGLGDKIEEPWFEDWFKDKGLNGTDWRVKKDGGDFDQLTGATISTRAIVGAVERGLKLYQENQAKISATGEGS
jgi:electron transport complex protein RnfG